MKLTTRNLKVAVTGLAACVVLLSCLVTSAQHFEGDKKAKAKGTIQARSGGLGIPSPDPPARSE